MPRKLIVILYIFFVLKDARGQQDNNTDAGIVFTEMNNNNNNNNNTALSVTTEEDDVMSTTEFTMTRPDDWLEFFPPDLEECYNLLDRVYFYFNISAIQYLWCFCYGFQHGCPEPYKSMDPEEFKQKKSRYRTREIERHFERQKEERISLYTIYGVTCAVGVFGNVLVLVTVIFFMPPGNVTNIFIGNLAVADLLVLTISLPFKIYEIHMNRWYTYLELCNALYFLYWMCFMVSVFTLTAMALERYIAICHPMKVKYLSTVSRAWKICAAIWIAATLLSLPIAIVLDVEWGASCGIEISRSDQKTRYMILSVYVAVVCFLVPVITMGGAYGRTGYVLWRSVAEAKRLQGPSGDGSERKNRQEDPSARLQVVRMLAVVFVIFVICWLPNITYLILSTYVMGGSETLPVFMSNDQENIIVMTTTLLTYFNSCLNPYIYAVLSRQIRRGYIRCLKCGRAGRYEDKKTMTSSAASKSTRQTSVSASVAAKDCMAANPSQNAAIALTK